MITIDLGRGYKTIIDDEDAHLADFGWKAIVKPSTHNLVYAVKKTLGGAKNRKTLILHRVIMENPPRGMVVDHINGDTLDNRRCNLRVTTHQENMRNILPRKRSKTGVCGVFLYKKRTDKFIARIPVNGKNLHLGVFETIEDAAKARADAEIKYWGNVPPRRPLS